MHTVWKGAISFGLVHVPVKMHTAAQDKDISLRMIHEVCGSTLRYVRECPVCEVEVPWSDIVKGYEYEKGHFVLFTKEELQSMEDEGNRTITILDFVDLSDIDPVYYQKTYYLSPDQAGGNAYQLLREALHSTNKIGIAKVTLRDKSSLAAIRVLENCLVMETMYYPDEIRNVSQVPNIPSAVSINPRELELAQMLINQLSASFEPEKYTDEHRERMLLRIQEKIAGKEVKRAPEAANEPPIADLMAALQASIQAMQPVMPDTGLKPASSARARGKAAAGDVKPAAAAVPTAGGITPARAAVPAAAGQALQAAATGGSQAAAAAGGALAGAGGADMAAIPAAPVKRRGRPRKNTAAEPVPGANPAAEAAQQAAGAGSSAQPAAGGEADRAARPRRRRTRAAEPATAAAGADFARSAEAQAAPPAPTRRGRKPASP
ncbi:non-homologous end joining protein Ku [Paenibacillus aquistagni]|uniref:non-homologous end joining protein Ku n=1 Tax=Paenibacillus aquistagni TaxID=1852522 RepID=UPI00145C0221|nr:Ku protein [Paenibacillus aquistagni]